MKTSIRPEQGGIPTGGSAAEVLAKLSGTDYDVDWAAASGGGSAFPQVIGLEAAAGYVFKTVASAYNDGSVIFAVALSGSQAKLVRLALDTTGQYYITHESTDSLINNTDGVGVAVVGSFVYVRVNLPGTHVVRFNAADLTGAVDCTIAGGTAAGSAGNCQNNFGSSTHLYLQDVSSGDWFRYSISGTTITKVGAITFGAIQNSCYTDDTDVFSVTGSAGNIQKAPIAGGMGTTATRNYRFSTLVNTSVPQGVTYISSTAIYYWMVGLVSSAASATQSVLYGIPAAKP